jgi:hypothetical protein
MEGAHNDMRPPAALDAISDFIFDHVLPTGTRAEWEHPLSLVPASVAATAALGCGVLPPWFMAAPAGLEPSPAASARLAAALTAAATSAAAAATAAAVDAEVSAVGGAELLSGGTKLSGLTSGGLPGVSGLTASQLLLSDRPKAFVCRRVRRAVEYDEEHRLRVESERLGVDAQSVRLPAFRPAALLRQDGSHVAAEYAALVGAGAAGSGGIASRVVKDDRAVTGRAGPGAGEESGAENTSDDDGAGVGCRGGVGSEDEDGFVTVGVIRHRSSDGDASAAASASAFAAAAGHGDDDDDAEEEDDDDAIIKAHLPSSPAAAGACQSHQRRRTPAAGSAAAAAPAPVALARPQTALPRPPRIPTLEDPPRVSKRYLRYLLEEAHRSAAYRLLSHDSYLHIVLHRTVGLTFIAPWSGVPVGHVWYQDLDKFEVLGGSGAVFDRLDADWKTQKDAARAAAAAATCAVQAAGDGGKQRHQSKSSSSAPAPVSAAAACTAASEAVLHFTVAHDRERANLLLCAQAELAVACVGAHVDDLLRAAPAPLAPFIAPPAGAGAAAGGDASARHAAAVAAISERVHGAAAVMVARALAARRSLVGHAVLDLLHHLALGKSLSAWRAAEEAAAATGGTGAGGRGTRRSDSTAGAGRVDAVAVLRAARALTRDGTLRDPEQRALAAAAARPGSRRGSFSSGSFAATLAGSSGSGSNGNGGDGSGGVGGGGGMSLAALPVGPISPLTVAGVEINPRVLADIDWRDIAHRLARALAPTVSADHPAAVAAAAARDTEARAGAGLRLGFDSVSDPGSGLGSGFSFGSGGGSSASLSADIGAGEGGGGSGSDGAGARELLLSRRELRSVVKRQVKAATEEATGRSFGEERLARRHHRSRTRHGARLTCGFFGTGSGSRAGSSGAVRAGAEPEEEEEEDSGFTCGAGRDTRSRRRRHNRGRASRGGDSSGSSSSDSSDSSDSDSGTDSESGADTSEGEDKAQKSESSCVVM